MTIDETQYHDDDHHWHSFKEMNTPRITIEELLPPEEEAMYAVAAVQGNREAFGRLYDAYFDYVYDAAARIEGNHPDAEDLTNRAMKRHEARLDSGDQTIMHAPYLHVLMGDLAEEAQRNHSLRERVKKRLLHRAFPERYATTIYESLMQFSRDDRILLALVYAGGLTPQEAADALHCDIHFCMGVLDHAKELAASGLTEFSETE